MNNTIPNDGCLKRIHVNQNLLRKAIAGDDVCPYIIQYKGKSHPCKEWEVNGNMKGVNRIHKPLSCGARLFLETTAEVLYAN